MSSSLYDCFDSYFAETKIEDGEFIAESEISESEIEDLKKRYDVTIEKQQYMDFSYQDTRLRLFAGTEKMDIPTVTEGRDIQEADDLVAEFSLYCPIIMIVVIAVIAMVLARTVRREGKTIGTLLALGYRKKELIRYYMVYGLIPAFVGDILGVILCIPFSKAFCSFYFADAEYIDYAVKMPWKFIGIVLLVPILVYGLVSYLVLCGVLRSEIIPLLKGIREEKTSKILNGSSAKLSFIYNIRSAMGNGLRSITLVIGIAVATLCIVLGGSFQDAYDNLLEEKVPYAMMGGQYEYGFAAYQTENPYGGNAVFDVSFGAKTDDSRFNLIGYEKENDLTDLKTEDGKALSYGDYYMTSSAARQYGIKAGDTFSFYNTVTMEESSVVISGIVKNDILTLVLTGKENAAEILERPVDEYNVIISKEKLDIPADLLKKAASLEDYRNMVENLSTTAGIVLKLLKVLGYRDGEVQKFVLAAYAFAMGISGRKCRKVDMAESLKGLAE